MIEVSIFLDESDLHEGRPKHEYIMRYLMHHEINGATMFGAIMGYGKRHHLHHPKSLGGLDEAPLMIVFIDEDEKVRKVLPHLKEVVIEGLIVMKKVERV